MPLVGFCDTWVKSCSSDWPDQKMFSNLSICRLSRANNIHLSKMIAQHQIDAMIRPIITSLTTIWACQKSDRTEKLPAGAASAV